ncbi:unnamed protein product [Chrysoparadoxa australica]
MATVSSVRRTSGLAWSTSSMKLTRSQWRQSPVMSPRVWITTPQLGGRAPREPTQVQCLIQSMLAPPNTTCFTHENKPLAATSPSSKHCQSQGCHKAPCYGFVDMLGFGEPVSCSQHKTNAMSYIKHQKGSKAGANSRGSIAAAANAADAKHATEVPKGLVHVPNTSADRERVHHIEDDPDHPLCRSEGCTKAPSYGYLEPGHSTGLAMYCSGHHKTGMQFLKHPVFIHHSPSPPKTISKEMTRPAEKSCIPSPQADLSAVMVAIQVVRNSHEPPGIGIKYLRKIIQQPDDPRYRTLKLSNHNFSSEVWLNPGMRTVFKSLGFVQQYGGLVTLEPLHPATLEAINTTVKKLSEPQDKKPRSWPIGGPPMYRV